MVLVPPPPIKIYMKVLRGGFFLRFVPAFIRNHPVSVGPYSFHNSFKLGHGVNTVTLRDSKHSPMLSKRLLEANRGPHPFCWRMFTLHRSLTLFGPSCQISTQSSWVKSEDRLLTYIGQKKEEKINKNHVRIESARYKLYISCIYPNFQCYFPHRAHFKSTKKMCSRSLTETG